MISGYARPHFSIPLYTSIISILIIFFFIIDIIIMNNIDRGIF